MRQTSNLGLALYDSEDKMNITGAENSLNHNMELIDEAVSGKQEVLRNGQNIKTINGQSILGGGNIEISSDGTGNNVSIPKNESDQYEDISDLFMFELYSIYGALRKLHFPIGTMIVPQNTETYDVSIALDSESVPWNNFDGQYTVSENTEIDRIVVQRKDNVAISNSDDAVSNVFKIIIPINRTGLGDNKYGFVDGLAYALNVYFVNNDKMNSVYKSSYVGNRYVLPLILRDDTIVSFETPASVSTYYYCTNDKVCPDVSKGEIYNKKFEKGKYILYFWDTDTFEMDTSIISFELASVTGKQITIYNYNDTYFADGRMIQAYNPYKNKGNVKSKGQLHCHTTNSDGDYSPSQVCSDYKTEGYDFITITDHNYVTKEPSDNELIWLFDSYEDTRNTSGNQHMNIYNADMPINKVSSLDNTNTPDILIENFVKSGESLLQYNHPEDPVVYASDARIKDLPKGISFIEVYNGSEYHTLGEFDTLADFPTENVRWNDRYLCKEDGQYYANRSKTSTPDWQVRSLTDYPDETPERAISILLDNGYKVFATATDDYHSKAQFNRGWVVTFSKHKTKNSIINALATGCFYASSGVVLNDITVEDGVYSIAIDNGEDCKTTFYGEDNAVLKEMEGSNPFYEMTGTEKYVRATISRPDGVTSAWTQPVWNLNKTYQFDLVTN